MYRFNTFPLLLLLCFSYCLIQGSFYPILVLLFSLLHESGHLLAIYALGGKSALPKGGGQGFSITFSNLGYRQEFFAAFAGPAINLLLAALFGVILLFLKGDLLNYCIFANLMLAAINFLPIFPLDGGRMLSCLLSYRLEPAKKAAVLKNIGLLFLIPLLALAFWQFLESRYNISLLIICFYLSTLIIAQSKGDLL